MKKIYIKNISFFLLILIPLTIWSQDDWSLSKDSEGIKIWVRNFEDSRYKEYKAVTSIKTTLDKVIQELLTAPRYNHNCEDGVSHLVKVSDNKDYIFYVKNDFPWPITDRDVVSKLKLNKISNNKVELSISSASTEVPEVKNILRVRELVGHWLLEEKNGYVQVTQQLYVNPEGTLPSFITNSLLVLGPFRTFQNLRSTLENEDS